MYVLIGRNHPRKRLTLRQMVTLLVGTTLALAAGVAAGIPLRNDLGNMSMAIDTSSSLARR